MNKIKKNLTFSASSIAAIEEAAKELGLINKNGKPLIAALIEEATVSYLENKQNFVCCPECSARYVQEEKLTDMSLLTCVCRECSYKFYYDVESGKLLK